MKDLIVVAYKNPYRAKDMLTELRRLNTDALIEIKDAVAVMRDGDGNLQVQDSYLATSTAGAGWGAVVGALLGGLALAPLTGGASAATAAALLAFGATGGAAVGSLTGAVTADVVKDHLGLAEDFVAAATAAIGPGDSAIVALVEGDDPEWIATYFRGTGGTILRTNLSRAQAERLQAMIRTGH